MGQPVVSIWPTVSHSHCILVLMCPSPIMSQSHYIPAPLCPNPTVSSPIVYKAHSVPFPGVRWALETMGQHHFSEEKAKQWQKGTLLCWCVSQWLCCSLCQKERETGSGRSLSSPCCRTWWALRTHGYHQCPATEQTGKTVSGKNTGLFQFLKQSCHHGHTPYTCKHEFKKTCMKLRRNSEDTYTQK